MSKEELIDKEYVLSILNQAKQKDNLKDYKLCFVSNAGNSTLIENTINQMITYSMPSGVKTDGISFVGHGARNGDRNDKYIFYFVKDNFYAGVNEIKDYISSLAKYNPMLQYRIINEGKGAGKKHSLVDDHYINLANHTFFVDSNDELKTLNSFPVIQYELKDDEQSKAVFMDRFIHAKNEYKNIVNLSRRKKGDKYVVSFETLPNFIDIWNEKRKENNISFSNFVDEIINGIRLDLDQTQNSCKTYEVISPDGKVSPLTKENQSYIGKANKSSYCLIGDANFDSKTLCEDYESIYSFGNAYPVGLLMFLPDRKTLEELVKAHQNYINIIFDEEKSKEEKIAYIKQLNKNIYEKMTGKLVTETGFEPFVIFDENYFNINDITSKENISKYRAKLEKYQYFYNLRRHMNYKDPNQDNRIIKMQNILDMGYSFAEKEDYKNKFGEIGAKIYDRFYCIQFTKYLMENYKLSGALLDLTYLSDKFIPKNIEEQLLKENSNSKEDIDTLIKMSDNSTIEDYMNIIKRFDGIINIDIKAFNPRKKERNYDENDLEEAKLVDKYRADFDKVIETKIKNQLGKIVTPWTMYRMGMSFKETGYTGASAQTHISKVRQNGLKEILNQANSLPSATQNNSLNNEKK